MRIFYCLALLLITSFAFSMENQTITLIDNQNNQYSVPKRVALQIESFKMLLESSQTPESKTSTIRLRDLLPADAQEIAQFMNEYSKDPTIASPENVWKKVITIHNPQQFLNAANFLDFKPFTDYIAQLTVKKSKGSVKELVNSPSISSNTREALIQAYLKNSNIGEISKSGIAFSVSDYIAFRPDLLQRKYFNQYLDLSHLSLKSLLGLHEIPDKNSIVTLSLDSNPLGSITRDIFRGFQNLRTLSLDNTELHTIEPESFLSLQKLWTLRLNDNPIKIIRADMFSGLNALIDLSLGNTQLQSLDSDSFKNTPNIEHLYLNHNNFKSIDPIVFKLLVKLQSINLMNNPLSQENEEKIRNTLSPKIQLLF